MGAHSDLSPTDTARLESWKEIAAYLGRTERTVRRWEDSLGLPVHRLAHEKRNSVYAYRAELDAWREAREPKLNPEPESPTTLKCPAPVGYPSPEASRSRRRFRWIFPVAAVPILALAAWLLAGFHSTPRVVSIAVLPFDNFSNDPGQDWFSDGMTEILITELSKLHSLRVISRTSIKRFKGPGKNIREIGKELGVDAVVEGSALRVGDHVRVTAQLISTATDTHLWGSDFDGEMKDVMSLQRDVARAISREVGSQLAIDDRRRLAKSPEQVDPRAMSSYLSALNLYRRNDFRAAADLAREAIHIDPRFGAAHELLGIILETMADDHMATHSAILPEAQAALQRAIELDRDSGTAVSWLGATYFFGKLDWTRAEPYLRRGFALNPASGSNFAWFLAARGKYSEAVGVVDRALQFDPFNPDLLTDSGRVYEFARRYDESARLYQKAWDLNPGGGYAHWFLPISLILANRPDEAFEHFYITRDGRGPLGRGPEFRRIYKEGGWSAVWKAWLDGRPPDALDDFSRWARILLHRDAETLDMLERLEGINDSWMAQLEDPVYDHLRPNPRFRALLKRVGYPPEMWE